MKKIIPFLFVLCLFFACNSTSSSKKNEVNEPQLRVIHVKTIKLNEKGITFIGEGKDQIFFNFDTCDRRLLRVDLQHDAASIRLFNQQPFVELKFQHFSAAEDSFSQILTDYRRYFDYIDFRHDAGGNYISYYWF